MRYPLDNPNIGQPFGADPVVSVDTYYGSTLVKAGEHVYKILANQNGHNGTDFPMPIGTPIKAIADGFIIEQTSKETGYGLRITQRFEVEGKIYMAIYGHMERLENPTNISYNFFLQTNPVKEGDIIGYVDTTGAATGPHLHLGIYPCDESGNKLFQSNGYGGAIDPILFLNALKIKDKNMFVKTMKYITSENPNGIVGFFVMADTEDHLQFAGKLLSKEVQINPDNSITTELTVIDKI